MNKGSIKYSILVALIAAAAPVVASATAIVASTVPWLPSSPTTPHSTWNNNSTTLKGVSNVQDPGNNSIVYDWNPGDGGSHCTGTVTNANIIECVHTYTGASIGTVYNATLTVYDNTTGTGVGGSAPYANTSTASYYVEIYAPPPNLNIEVNAAIDAGLWYLHKGMVIENVTPGVITGVTMTSGGSDYQLYYQPNPSSYCCTDVSVSFTGAGNTGSGASGTANVDTTPSSATYGQILGITVSNGGSGYVAPVTMTITDNYCFDKSYYSGSYGPGCGSGASGTVAVATSTYNVNKGYWSANNYAGVAANNCNAFEVSGHLESGPSSDPYTADVHACLQYVFSLLQTVSISNTSNTHGTVVGDSNGNGLGVHEVDGQGEDQYQSGMMVDVITASGTPNTVVTTGPLASLGKPAGRTSGPNAYTYKDAVVDMVDYDIYCQESQGNVNAQGSWVYGCQPSYGDNSVAQWVTIGIISGIRDFGATVDNNAKLANVDWLNYSQNQGFISQNGADAGSFGYSGTGYAWGPYAVTPAGMVQLAWNGIGRNASLTCCNPSGATKWDWAETYMRDNFDTPQQNNAQADVKDYYYGLFSLTKSMLLHDNTAEGGGQSPIQYMRSLDNNSKPPIDWYAAQTAAYGGSDTSNGVARTLISGTPSNGVSGQNSDGSWSGHDYTSTTSQFNTGWAIIMLNKTVTQIQPTACITPVSPTNQNGVSVTISAACSGTTDPTKTITSYQWDTSCTAGGGTNFTSSGLYLTHTFTNPSDPTGYPYLCPVRLRVTDSGGLTADLVFNETVTAPASYVAPTTNVGGPYSFCQNITPWYFDGSHTTQAAPLTITGYAWDYSCSNTFTSSTAIQPRVDTGANNIFGLSPGSYCVALKVTNSDNLTATQSTTYNILSSTATACTDCAANLIAKAKNAVPGSPGNVQLYWNDVNSANLPVTHYNIYRSSNANFSPFITVAGQGGAFAAVPTPAVHGAQITFVDKSASTAGTYYYRISPATSNDSSTCTSPITIGATVASGR